MPAGTINIIVKLFLLVHYTNHKSAHSYICMCILHSIALVGS